MGDKTPIDTYTQETDDRPTPPTAPEAPAGPSLLTLGTAVVIGALAANVIGFRYSRWAVGKDVHRAWERHQRNTASNQSFRKAQDRTREASARAARQAAEKAKRESAARATERAERMKREETRDKYRMWEDAFRRDGRGETEYREVWMEFDPRVVEEVLRVRRGASRGSGRGNPFGMSDEMLREMLRAVEGREGGREEFDWFGVWERGDTRWGGFEHGHGGSGGMPSGVFRGAGLDRHYSALGLQVGASDEQVKKAYRREVLKWHPDRYRGPDAEQAARRFRQVTEAYDAIAKQ